MTQQQSTAFLIGLALCLGLSGPGHADEPKAYNPQFALYRISDVPIHLLTKDQAKGLINPPDAKAWNETFNVDFRGMHLQNVLDLFAQKYNMNFIVEAGVVAPKSATDSGTAADRQYATDGIVDHVDLKGTNLREFLAALLEPLGLDYFVYANSVWITTTERAKARAPLRTYTPGADLYVQDAGAVAIGDIVLPLGPGDHSVINNELKETDHIHVIARPSIAMLEGQDAKIATTDRTPVEYLEPVEPGRFRLRHEESKTGLVLTPSIRSGNDATVQLGMKLWTSYLKGREPLEGTSLAVGPPIFHEREVEGAARVRLNHRAAALTQIGHDGKEVLLVLFRVSPMISRDEAAERQDPLPEYRVEMRFIQIEGRPDWGKLKNARLDAESSVQTSDDRWFGPIAWTGFSKSAFYLDRFRSIEQDNLFVDGRVTHILDLKRHQREGTAPNLYKMIVAPGPNTEPTVASPDASGVAYVDEEFNRLAPESQHRSFRRDDLEGKVFLIVKSWDLVKYRDPGFWLFAQKHEVIIPVGVFVMLDATSTRTPGRCRLNQLVQFRQSHLNVPNKIVGKEAALATRFYGCGHFSYEVEDGQTIGYLLPVRGDEYVLVLSTFTLVDKPRSAPKSK